MNVERWRQLTKNDQFAAISAEVVRAKIWENKNKNNFLGALERAFELIDLSLDDPQWASELYVLLYVRDEIGKFYVRQKSGIEKLYAAL